MTTCRLALVLALAAGAAARPRYANETDREPLPDPAHVLAADDSPLGTVRVTVAPTRAPTLNDTARLRAAVVSGVALATDWVSVDDVTSVKVGGTEDCGATGPVITYTLDLAPAVMPTAEQARQLSSGVVKAIDKQLMRDKIEARVDRATADLDAALFRERAAPFPANARAGSNNVMLGWLRATGKR